METWLDVVGYEGLYQVSNLGIVKSLERTVKLGNVVGVSKERILKSSLGHYGYPLVCLCQNGKAKSMRVHRLVAEAFIPNPENKSQVNHINGYKMDNRVENLEWATNGENQIHSYRTLGKTPSMSGKIGKDCPNSKAILQFTKEGCFIAEYDSAKDAYAETMISRGNISSCCTGRIRSAGGFVWKFKNKQ